MAKKRCSVVQWSKRALQAAQMKCGACTEALNLVGIDMMAQDGNTFAHGHFDLRTAREFHKHLGETIEEATAKYADAHCRQVFIENVKHGGMP